MMWVAPWDSQLSRPTRPPHGAPPVARPLLFLGGRGDMFLEPSLSALHTPPLTRGASCLGAVSSAASLWQHSPWERRRERRGPRQRRAPGHAGQCAGPGGGIVPGGQSSGSVGSAGAGSGRHRPRSVPVGEAGGTGELARQKAGQGRGQDPTVVPYPYPGSTRTHSRTHLPARHRW